MSEGILIYGMTGRGRRRYTHDLQSFAKEVLKRNYNNGSIYIFGFTNKRISKNQTTNGDIPNNRKIAIRDYTIRKYKNHPKKEKNAVISFRRFVKVEAAVKHPKNIYIDTKRNRLIYVSTTNYSDNKILKVIIDPNKKIGKQRYDEVVSIGIVPKNSMNNKQYLKLK